MEAVESFLKDFPTITKVYEYFAPMNWGKAQKLKNELAVKSCITLGQLDVVYNVEGAAKMVVKVNLGGVYSLGMNRELMNQNTADMVADMFVARYGDECTMYGLMIYFSGYLMDYKGTYANYDVQDILLQFSKKFMPWWRLKQGTPMAVEKKKDEYGGPTGLEGLKCYLRVKYRNGENLREGGLWDHGYVNEELVSQIEAEMRAGDIAF